MRLFHTDTLLPLLSRTVTLGAMVALVGMLPWLSGHDPALALLRARSGDQEATPETLNAIRDALGLDQGPLALLQQWLLGLLHGDAGNSWVSGRPVGPGMLQAAGVSLTLMAFALLVAALVAAAICLRPFLAGLAGRGRRPAGALPAMLTALPEFLLASLLLLVGAVWLRLFPPFGWQSLHHALLPALALGIPAGGLLGRLFSDAFAATFHETWLLTWQMAGVSRAWIARAVFLRSLPGLLPQVGLVVIGLTGGAMAVEKVFAIPGLGRATLGAVAAQDLPALQTGLLMLLLLACAAGVAANLMRRVLLGPALHAGALPVTAPETAGPRGAWAVPLACAALLMLMVITGLPRDPVTPMFMRLQAPGWDLPFGADATGRDLLARVAHGALHTCALALGVTLASLLLGVLAGLFPRLSSGPVEAANAMPPVIAGLVVAAINGPTAGGAALAVLATSWAPLAAHTAALVSEINAQPHIRILPVLGVGPWRRTLRYLLPALSGPLLRHAMLRLPGTVLALAALGFLGLGAPPPAPEWGRVLAEGMPYLERAPWAVLAPGGALILFSVLAVTTAGLAGRRKRARAAIVNRSTVTGTA